MWDDSSFEARETALPSPSFGPVTQTRKVGPDRGAALRAMRFSALFALSTRAAG